MKRLAVFGLLTSLALPAIGRDLVVWWDPPTSNEDGSPITDLTGYRVYWGGTSGCYTVSLDAGTGTVAVVRDAPDRTVYLAVTAYDSRDIESNFSEEVVATTTTTTTTTPRIYGIDWREPYWKLDALEVSRVLGIWRQGGYHFDTNAVGGYAIGEKP